MLLSEQDTGSIIMNKIFSNKKNTLKKIIIMVSFLTLISVAMSNNIPKKNKQKGVKAKSYKEIKGTIKKGDTLFTIFKKYRLELNELHEIKRSSKEIHDLKKLVLGRPYMLSIDKKNKINSFIYHVDEDALLNVTSSESGFQAEKITLDYDVQIKYIGGTIKDNLVSSIGEDKDNMLLALEIADIFSWDIDFSTDIRKGDNFKVIVEALFHKNEFKKYGNILAIEFVNSGTQYKVYRFESEGHADYYDSEGKSIKKTFLKAPLNFKRITSHFSGKRYHPILKILRPHHGVDYAAPSGTPVSATGNGTVAFAGCRGAYGNLIIIKHNNNYETYYGHLSKISKGIKKGARVNQGDVIGYVGKTGLATGPHLHYEMRIADKHVNPLDIKHPFKKGIAPDNFLDFKKVVNSMNNKFASIPDSTYVYTKFISIKEQG